MCSSSTLRCAMQKKAIIWLSGRTIRAILTVFNYIEPSYCPSAAYTVRHSTFWIASTQRLLKRGCCFTTIFTTSPSIPIKQVLRTTAHTPLDIGLLPGSIWKRPFHTCHPWYLSTITIWAKNMSISITTPWRHASTMSGCWRNRRMTLANMLWRAMHWQAIMQRRESTTSEWNT